LPSVCAVLALLVILLILFREKGENPSTEPSEQTVQQTETVAPTEDPTEIAFRKVEKHCQSLWDEGDWDKTVAYLENMVVLEDDPRYDSLLNDYFQKRKDAILSGAQALADAGKYRQAIQKMDHSWKKYHDPAYYEADVEYRREFSVYPNTMVDAGKFNTIIRYKDGTVKVFGDESNKENNADSWKNIVVVSGGDRHILGLTESGIVVAAGENKYEQRDVAGAQDVIVVSAGDVHSVVLFKDGSLQAEGFNDHGQKMWKTLKRLRLISVLLPFLPDIGRPWRCWKMEHSSDAAKMKFIASMYTAGQILLRFTAGPTILPGCGQMEPW
jgi:hypothetical protein